MNYTLHYLLNHGYSVLFAWVLAEQAGAPIQSAPILLAAGALVGFGRMNGAAALGLPLAACLIGDCVWFSPGTATRSYDSGTCPSHISALFPLRPRVYRAREIHAWIRISGAPLAGSMGVSPLKFLLFDAVGALAWAGSHLLLGYLFRKNLETMACVCAKAGVLVAVSLVIAVALVVTIKRFRGSPANRNSPTERSRSDGRGEFVRINH